MRLVEKLRRISAPAAMAPMATAAEGGVPAELPGELIESESGTYRRVRIDLPLDHVHGRFSLQTLASTSLARLAALANDPALIGLDARQCIYFDTETTSLGGGVGTYVFLFGAGWFEQDCFRVEQYFLDNITGERALLEAINDSFARFQHVVSFHGKGFDAPRLGGRLLFHRMSPRFPPAHLDLCVLGRKLYRDAYENCRLQTFERRIVGHQRADDFPGADCPRAFFDHLLGDSQSIPRVFEHNFLDVLTLPAVAAALAAEAESPSHPVVLSNLGVHYESVGRDREAREAYVKALEGLRDPLHPLLGRTLERLALLERRAGRHAESAEFLLERVRMLPHAFQPLEDLAKYYEHRARDLGAALATAIDARSRIVTGKIEADSAGRRRCLRALDHRIARLQRLLPGAIGGPPAPEPPFHPRS